MLFLGLLSDIVPANKLGIPMICQKVRILPFAYALRVLTVKLDPMLAKQRKQTPCSLVRKRTIPTEQLPHVGEI
jgi:hypothetical protein